MTITRAPRSVVAAGTLPPHAERIARKVRARIAEEQLTQMSLANELQMDQRAFSRRFRGEVAWAVDELFDLAPLLGTSFEALCASRDSNPEPADYVAQDQPVVRIPAQRRPPNLSRIESPLDRAWWDLAA